MLAAAAARGIVRAASRSSGGCGTAAAAQALCPAWVRPLAPQHPAQYAQLEQQHHQQRRHLATKAPNDFRVQRRPQHSEHIKVMRTLSKKGDFEGMLQRLDAAIAAAAAPEEVADAYAVAATNLARGALADQAMELLERARAAGVVNASVFAAAASAANKVQRPEVAMKVFREMRAAGLEAPPGALCVAAEASARMGDWKTAAELAKEMREQRNMGEPGGLYDMALQACTAGGPIDRIYEWLDNVIVMSKKEAGARVGRAPIRESAEQA